MESNNQFEVIIIGGSYAGLSAAMALGRARRRVLIIDSGKPCNETAPHSHNFLTQDGVEPSKIASLGKAQVLAYPTVTFLDDLVVSINGSDQNFNIFTAIGTVFAARKILFAAGVKDLLPETHGFKECWGKSIIHCPYCHGYEYKDQPTGVMANGDMAFEFGRLIRNWTDKLTIFTNGVSAINNERLSVLGRLGIAVETSVIVHFNHQNGFLSDVFLANGNRIKLDAMYAKVPFEQNCKGLIELGCQLTDAGFVMVDDLSKTNVPGVFAAGDCTTLFRSVAGAVATGSKAGAMLNHEMIAQA